MENKPNKSGSGMEPNIAAALAYILTPLTGVLVFLMEKENAFVKFHAIQSTILGVTWLVLNIILAPVLVALLIGVLVIPLANLGLLIAWVMAIWKAYNNERYELPVIGAMASKQVNKI